MDGVESMFGSVQLAVDIGAFHGGPDNIPLFPFGKYIANNVDACLGFGARVGHYGGIIDGLARCCDWVWTLSGLCDGQRWTLGHWCGGRVCG